MGATLDSLPKLANNFVETRTKARETEDYMDYKNASKELKKDFLQKIRDLSEKKINLDETKALYSIYGKKVQKKINEWAEKAGKKGELTIQKDGEIVILNLSLLTKLQKSFNIVEHDPKYLALKKAKSAFKTALKDLKEQKISLDEIKKYLNENRVLDEKTKDFNEAIKKAAYFYEKKFN